MAVQTAAGTRIALSPNIPATIDANGYEAINNFADLGEITDAGSHGRVYQPVLHNPLGTRGTQKFKGSYNEGTKTIQMAIDDDDPGQIVARQALNSDSDYSFRVTYPDGSKDYFQAKVMSFQKQASTVDTVISASMDLEITSSKDGTGIVEVSAGPAGPFTLTYTADANGSLIGTSPQTVNRGASGTPVAAVPAAGFLFDKWSDNSTANPRVDANVTAAVTVTATFVAE